MMDITSDKLMDKMLAHQLDGNEMKLIIAYVKLGGWKAGTEVFLPEAKRIEWGISDATAKRMRKTLKAKGWLVPTGNKSRYGCDKYLVVIPAMPEVGQNDLGRSVNLTGQVGQFDPSGGSIRPLEVIKEVTNEATKSSNEAPAAHAPGKPVTSTFLIVNDKEEQEVDDSLITLNEPVAAVVPIVAKEKEVGQIDPPLNEDDYYEWNGRMILKSGHGDPFGGVATAPVEPEVIRIPCPKCSEVMDKLNLCWNMECA